MKTIDEIRAAFMRVHHRACGDDREVYMSVPADPERDADLIVTAAIDELAALREALKKCVEALGEDAQLRHRYPASEPDADCPVCVALAIAEPLLPAGDAR